MHTFFKNKSLGFGVGTLLPPSVKNVFRDDLIRDDLDIVKLGKPAKMLN